MKILLLQANPKRTTALHLAEEARRIRERLIAHSPLTDLIVAGAVRPEDLSALIYNYQPDVVHFSGHGTEIGEIVLEGPKSFRRVKGGLLADAFSNLAPSVKCVVLNSCYSAVQARAIAKQVPCVIGMKSAVSDNAAISFASGFYLGLVIGKSIQAAVHLASYETRLSGLDDELQVKLIVRPGNNAPDPRTIYLVRGPQLLAHFAPDDKPKKRKSAAYDIVVYVRDSPSSTNCCVYQYIDEDGGTIRDSVSQVENYRKGFPSECRLYGDVIVRATLWSHNTGIGISRPLSDALEEHYGIHPSKKVRKALKDIAEN